MTELDFKNYIFSEACDISSTALVLLVYIKMQCRERYVFKLNTMMNSIKVKDKRTVAVGAVLHLVQALVA